MAEKPSQRCSRCHGLLVETYLMDMGWTGDPSALSAWRCVSCGHITDDGFMANRQKTHVLVRVRGRRYRVSTRLPASVS